MVSDEGGSLKVAAWPNGHNAMASKYAATERIGTPDNQVGWKSQDHYMASRADLRENFESAMPGRSNT